MPLDTSTYSLALLRLDGRRWNELRRLQASISTSPSADGSSYLEMGNTKVICTVEGPSEQKAGAAGGGGDGRGRGKEASVEVVVGVAPFAGTERRRPGGRGDKRLTELQTTLSSTFSTALFTHLFPSSHITIRLSILSSDGSLLAALINASTLALIDAGIPMRNYVSACTAGSTSSYSSNDEAADPLLDLNGQEEQELPCLTVATIGAGIRGEDGEEDEGEDEVVVCVCESKVQVGRLEGMLAVGVSGCRQVREVLEGIVRERGEGMVRDRD